MKKKSGMEEEGASEEEKREILCLLFK